MPSPWEMGRAQIGWWTIAGLLAAFLAYLFVSFVGTFVFGLFVYYATRPIYRRLRRVVRPPSFAAAISLVLIILPAILLLAYTIAIGLQEFSRLVEVQGLDIGQVETLIEPYVDISGLVTDPVAILSQQISFDAIWQNLGDAGAYVGFFGTAALHLFVIILLSFYLLRDDHRLADWFTERFTDADGVLETYVFRVDRDFSIIFFGNILNAFLTGVIGAIVYGGLDLVSPAGIGIPYSTLLGLLTGIASLVPVIGIKLVYFPLAGYLVYGTYQTPQLLWFPVLFVIVSFVVVDVIPDLVLRPYVSGRGLHLGMVMMAYVFGPLLFGWYGLFLGPMLLVLVVHFADLVLPELVEGREVRRGGRDEPRGRPPDDGGDDGPDSAGKVVESRSSPDDATDDPSPGPSDLS
ncbi:putative PurR-regulated permease PerM [Halanaeroarchaeum sp. HSR-CO]|uniref:AI-2E family transporter n=1 Tax=Halanaeroarchaeum sp. HSR-CO TaxID=2866382 RepID=UPI00217DE4F9|nr:AI-2E family transporter [Halanaeroarchaeum sp. HSR-CO]UWG48445.1 putative PurR-regulated permease PerM [Halanaeroarchaeum sp. HSR-CO]